MDDSAATGVQFRQSSRRTASRQSASRTITDDEMYEGHLEQKSSFSHKTNATVLFDSRTNMPLNLALSVFAWFDFPRDKENYQHSVRSQ